MPLLGEKNFKVINKSLPRIDGYDKVVGRAVYAGDIFIPNMLYGGMLRSGKSSAKIIRIDVKKAKSIPGVHAVVTADDMPVTTSWSGYQYLTNHIRYQGDCVALVAAESRALVEEALEAIIVEYEDLEAVYTIEDALKATAPLLHAERYEDNRFQDSAFKIRKGDVENAFKEADVIIERDYTTQHQEHAYIEPEAVVAVQNPGDGEMTVYASAQNPFFTRRYVADVLGISLNDVRIFQQTLGGSFGGKEEGLGLIAARAAYLCKACGRPVKIVWTREASLLESAKRHPYSIKSKIGVMNDGRIVALENVIFDESGAYNNQSQFINWKANAHSTGAYHIPNVKTDIVGVYTNRVHAGAFRGYGNPQFLFAMEQLVEEAAEKINMDPVEIRRINHVKDGSTTATGQVLENVTLTEVMEHTLEKADFHNKRALYEKIEGTKKKGIGMVIMMRGCGTGCETPDASGAMITIMDDGSILINSGLPENGQGLKTVYAQIAAETLDVPYESIRFFGTDTHAIPDSGMTVASRGTTMGSQSMRKSALELRGILLKNAAGILAVDEEDVTLEDGIFSLKSDSTVKKTMKEICNASLWSGKQLANYSWFTPPPLVQKHEDGQGIAFPQYAYGCVITEVEVDTETGFVDVLKVTASHDVGTAINPELVRGQILGGIVMGMGYGTMEEIKFNKGEMTTLNFDSYLIPTALDIPEIDINIFENENDKGTFGAKSIGEPALDGIAASIANAVYHATGKRIRSNPCSLEKVLLGTDLN